MQKRVSFGIVVAFFIGVMVVHSGLSEDGIMGMRIEEVVEDQGTVTVQTTGAKFILGPGDTLTCWQRIPKDRKVLEVKLSEKMPPFTVKEQDAFSCKVSSGAAELTLQADGLVMFKMRKNLTATFKGLFKPAYRAEKDGKWMMIDSDGGFGVYPWAKKEDVQEPAFDNPPWNLTYNFNKREQAWLSVFPPRPYNWERAFESIDHEGGSYPEYAYPKNELIQSAGKHCDIFAVHAYFWKDVPDELKPKKGKYANRRCPWLAVKHVPEDMDEFVRMRDETRKNGMKFVVYISPFYSKAPDIVAEVERVVKEYDVDGIYFDGISSNFKKSYDIIRRTRQVLGDRILYVHCSTDPLGGKIYCPFIDTYADYILRGEAGRHGLDLDDFLRWTVSGYHISNAVGYWCYYGSTGQKGYVPQVPTSEHIDAALRNHARIWRQEQSWTRAGGDIAGFDKEYYGKLEELRKQHEQQASKE